MSTAEAVEVVEEVTEVAETAKKGRKKGLKLFNHDKAYPTKENAKENEPYYAKEITVTKKNEKGENVEVEDYDHSNPQPVDGFRLYSVADMRSNDVKFSWGRNTADALATVASEFMSVELVDAQPRGRAKTLDPIYVMFFKQMLEQGKNNELLEVIKTQELQHYLPVLGIDIEGNKIAA